MTDTCRSCHAPVIWTTSESGKPMPLDSEPRSDGNVIARRNRATGDVIAHVLTAEERSDPQIKPRYVAHFVTCPNADQHRQASKGQPGPLDVAWVAAARRGDNAQAELIERALENAQTAPPEMPSPSTAAHWYALALGLRVFPLQPGDKTPYPGSHGFKDATREAWRVEEWWTLAPESNIGIATGDPYDVIDIDTAQGAEAFAKLTSLSDGAWVQVRAVTQTPRGLHLWVPAVDNASIIAGRPGLDYRGKGGYVVAPPSHINGTLYRWLLMPPPREGD